MRRTAHRRPGVPGESGNFPNAVSFSATSRSHITPRIPTPSRPPSSRCSKAFRLTPAVEGQSEPHHDKPGQGPDVHAVEDLLGEQVTLLFRPVCPAQAVRCIVAPSCGSGSSSLTWKTPPVASTLAPLANACRPLLRRRIREPGDGNWRGKSSKERGGELGAAPTGASAHPRAPGTDRFILGPTR